MNTFKLRRETYQVTLSDKLSLGSQHPILVQSMTNTPTQNISVTVEQIKELYIAGSAVVRLTVKDEAAAEAVPLIVSELNKQGLRFP